MVIEDADSSGKFQRFAMAIVTSIGSCLFPRPKIILKKF